MKSWYLIINVKTYYVWLKLTVELQKGLAYFVIEGLFLLDKLIELTENQA